MPKYEGRHAQTKDGPNEITLNEKLKGNTRFNTILTVEKLYQKVIKKLTMTTSTEAIAHSTAYKISDAHKTHMIDFELKRARALAEAQRQRLR